MTQTSAHDPSSLIGRTLYAKNEEKIGTIGQVYLDDASGAPEFFTVATGFFGTSESFVPVASAELQGDRVVVPYSKDQVKDAPNIDVAGGHLPQDEEDRLYEHYALGSAGTAGTAERDTTAGAPADTSGSVSATEINSSPETTPGITPGVTPGTTGHDTSGPTTDEAMTRSEEKLVGGTRTEEAGRVRLRKYVTTETESVEVPVTRERAYIEREPVTGGNVDEATDGPTISEEEHEVVLHEEHAEASTVAEPVERVRLGTETVEGSETVTEEVRKEHIETEGDVDERG